MRAHAASSRPGDTGTTRSHRGLAALATLWLAYAAGGVLHLVHLDEHERHAIDPTLHWLRDSSLSLPIALAAVVVAVSSARRLALWTAGGDEAARPGLAAGGLGALLGGAVFGLLSIPGNLVHGRLFVGEHEHHGTPTGTAGAAGHDHVAAAGTSVAGHDDGVVAGVHHLLADASVATAAAVAALLVVPLLVVAVRLRAEARSTAPVASSPALRARRGLVLATTAAVVAAPLTLSPGLAPAASGATAAAAAPEAGCDATTAARRYDVAAISVPIPYNRFGDTDPHGMAYVLEQDRAAVDHWYEPLAANPADDPAGNRRLRPRPLVIRANEGECVQVTFTNRLDTRALQDGAVSDPRASMSVSGAAVSAESDGGHVGYDGDTTVGRGETITYYWTAPRQEGLHLFRDLAMSAGGEADGGSVSHGLWGGFAVEPAGSEWFDSHSGLPLYPTSSVAQMSGELYLDANIKLPSGTFFRETVQISQDEIPGVGFGFNYGADAQANRDEKRCPDCVGEETSLSSWTYGDPAAVKLASGLPGATGWAVGKENDPEDCQSDDGVAHPAMTMPPGVPGGCWTSNVTHAYKGDPTKIRFGHAGVKETHVFHMHAHQWLSEPLDVGTAGSNPTTPSDTRRPEATTIDSQTFGPGDTFTADLLFGAGSKPGTIGDSIFHCHLYPHFADGFWSLFRVHDVFEDGTLETPDGVRTRLLTVLPDRKAAGKSPGAYDAQTNPGYPRFVPGKVGWRAPQPPAAISDPEGKDGIRMVAGQGLVPELLNQVQDVTVPAPGDPASAGDFSLTYRGETTALLAPTASAADVEAALEALDGVADVTVEARGDTGGSWRISFADPVLNVRALSSANPAVTITTVEGQWHRMLAAEKAAQQQAFAGTGTGPKPGAPFTDPCPSGAREVTYNVSVLQRDLVYNSDGWHDTQGRILVLTKDVPEIMAGTKKPEPLFFRANAGDCINFNLTNMLPNWYGNDAFQVLQQTNMFGQHIHLVKFDVLASDGSSNGWNYQQAAFTERQAQFDQDIIDGTQKCTADEAQGACRLELPGPTGYDPSAQRIFSGQTIHERWYADYELRTVFTHDHHFPAVDQGRGLFGGLIVEPQGMDFRNSRTGVYSQPINDAAHGPVCGGRCEGDAAGTTFDVIGPGAKDDFREFGLAFQDFVPLTRAGGDPQNPADVLNPPGAPEHFADDDPGVMGINYRNEPFQIRDTVNGRRTDPAHVFSSTLHGDPATPVLQAYAGDPVRVRLVAGSQEEQHVFGLHGMRWRDEPDDPDSPYTAAKALGVSEAFNFEIPEMDCAENTDCRGDYLYSSTATDDLYLGMWGLMRVFGKGVPTLKPLPDNLPQAANGNTTFQVTGEAPPLATKPGRSCPAGAPVRTFTVAATDAEITYNKDGDHDPYGLVYVAARPGESVDQAVARVRAHPEPMSLRANEGDCIEVRLHNRIDPAGAFATQHGPQGAADGDPRLPLEPPTGTPAGLRVSLHPQLLKFDVRGSDGATVGFNKDQTVAPGQDILYRWYADDVTPGELGAINLTDYGDVRGHRHHGLFASLTIEPKGSTYHDSVTGEELTSGAAADIRVPGRPDFREFTAFYQDGLNLRDAQGATVPDGYAHPPVAGAPPEALDSEDQGEKGFNYASSPFRHRLGRTPMAADASDPLSGRALADVFSSTVHGDPDTPVFRSYAGDPVRIRVLQGGDKPRQHNFGVHGHSWRVQADDPGSTRVGVQGGLSVDRALNIELDSTGNGQRGDYLYGDSVGFHHLSGGTWGLLRSYPAPAGGGLFQPSPLGTGTGDAADNPYRDGYTPLLPLERSSVTVSVFDDSNADATRGANEQRGPDTKVTLRSSDGSTWLTRNVRADGTATFSVGPGAYDVVADVPADWKRTTAATTRVDLTAENAAQDVSVGMVQLADVGVTLFGDTDGDNARSTGEPALAGWSVRLSKGTESYTGTTAADGSVAFDGLTPGSWAVSSPGQAGWQATRTLPATVSVAENQTRASGKDTLIGFAMPAGLSVKLFNDANEDGSQQAGESSRAGLKVTARGGPPERPVTVTATTDATGVATFEDPAPDVQGLTPGSYSITPEAVDDWTVTSGRATTTKDGVATPSTGLSCPAGACQTVLVEKTAQVATVAVHNPNATVEAAPFNDLNNDGVKQDKEKGLAGWSVTAISATGERQGLETGNNGRGMFYPMKPGSYTLEMISPEPSSDPNVLDWTATNRAGCVAYGTAQKRCQVPVDVIAGESVTGAFGFVQLGTVGVTAFHDYDKDGVWDTNEPAQANRTVQLYDATGKTLLQTKVTDTYGRVAFKAAAGVKYKITAVLPTGWKQTAPVTSTGVPVTSIAVTGPLGTQSLDLQVGQYNTADSIAPPVPTSSVAAGTYSTVQSVKLASETGAQIRYTLSGALPTATTGHVYAGPITFSNSHLLRAVAVDAAGNVSGELLSGDVVDSVPVPGLEIDVDLGTKAAQPATKWTVVTGGTPTPPTGMTVAGGLQDDDNLKVGLPSAYVTSSKSYVVEGYASMQLPLAQRNVVALGVELDGRASLAGSTRTLMLYDFTAATWVTLCDRENQPITDWRSVSDAPGNPARFVSSTGEVRLKLRAVRTGGAFDERLDQALVRVQHR